MSNARIHLMISGLVQGVFFRDSTRDVARKLGVNGWVRNLPDGRVEALFEGPKELVDKAVEFVHHGPPQAKVTGVSVEEQQFTGEFSTFEIVDE